METRHTEVAAWWREEHAHFTRRPLAIEFIVHACDPINHSLIGQEDVVDRIGGSWRRQWTKSEVVRV